MPATALKCRVCDTEYPLDPIGVCARCFGPLDPVYDRDEQRRTVSRESIAAGPQSLWRYAPLLPVAPPAEQRLPAGLDAAHPRAAPRGGGRRRRALAQARHGEPDALLQGSRRRGRGGEGDRARAHDARLLLDRQSRERRRSARGGRRARGRVLCPADLEPEKLDRDGDLRREDLRRRRQLRRLQPAHGRAVVRARLGVRERRSCARTTPRARRRSASRSPSSSAGSCPTP